MKKSNPTYYRLYEFNSYRIPFFTARIYRLVIKIFCALFIFWNKYIRKNVRNFFYKKIQVDFDIFNAVIMAAKYKHYIKNHKIINSLILGSSHAECGYRPCNSNEINLAFPSGDLYYSYKLFQTVNKNSPNLRNIILFFSPFSSGFYIQRSSVAISELTAIMSHLWGISRFSDGRITGTELDVDKSVNSFLNREYNHISEAYEDYISQEENLTICKRSLDKNKTDDQFIKLELQRTKKHLVYAIQDTAMPYLDKLLDEAGSGKFNIYIIIPPLRQIYIQRFDKDNSIFLHLNDYLIKYNNIRLLDFSRDPDFTDDDFKDIDHLNEKGARKLSHKIRNIVKGY